MMTSYRIPGSLVLVTVYIGVCTVIALADNIPRTCPTDYQYYSQGHKCYKINQDAQTWYDARERCQNEGADLVVIEDARTHNFISQYYNGRGIGRFFIGMQQINDSDMFRWVDGNTFHFESWTKLIPSNDVENEPDCCELQANRQKWNDLPCRTQIPSLCEKRPAIDLACPSGYVSHSEKKKCVKAVHNQVLSWGDARAVCQEDGGDLVIIKDDEYNTFIKSLLRDDHVYWIGLNNSGTSDFHWVDGSLMSYGQWAPYQPDFESVPGLNVCVEFRMKWGWDAWNDHLCHLFQNYICERDYTEPVSCLGETWILNGRNKKCYQVQTDARTFHESKATCRDKGGDLVTVSDNGIEQYAIGLIKESESRYWINGVEENSTHCVGRQLQSQDTPETQDVCDTPHPSVCERHTVRDHPVLECPHGYHTYVTTTTGWKIVCLMAENHQKKSWDDASDECRRVGGDLYYRPNETDMNQYATENVLIFGYSYWYKHVCVVYVHAGIFHHDRPCTDKHHYICHHWGNIKDMVQLKNIHGMIGQHVEGQGQNMSLVEVCRVYDMDTLHSFHGWTRNSSTLSVLMERSLTTLGNEDQNMRCLYGQQRDCCVEVTFTRPVDLANEHQLKMSFPMDKLLCLCPTPVTKQTVILLKNLTTPANSSSTPPNKLCPCHCNITVMNTNPSTKELSLILSRIQTELKVDTAQLSSKWRKKISAKDDRTESRIMGYLGVTLCFIPVCLLVVMDVSRLIGYIKKNNTTH